MKALFLFIFLLPSLAGASAQKCAHTFLTSRPKILIDLRQPILIEAAEKLVSSIHGNQIDQKVPVRVSKETYLSSNKPVDEFDKQLWALSRLNGGVETGFFEVVGNQSQILAIGEFTIGTKESVNIREEGVFEAIDALFKMGLSFKDIAYIGYRHVHPSTLNSGFFSWPDQMFLHQLQAQLQTTYGYRFPAQMVVLWQPNVSKAIHFLGGPDAISKRSALAVKLYDFRHEVIGDGYVGSTGGTKIPLTGTGR